MNAQRYRLKTASKDSRYLVVLLSDQRRGNSGNMAVVGAKGKGILLTNTTVTFRPRVVIECSEV